MDSPGSTTNQNPRVGEVVLDSEDFENKFGIIYRATQKMQDLLTLDVSPIGVFVNLFFKSFNEVHFNNKRLNKLLYEKWESCSDEMKEYCLSKSLKLSAIQRDRQQLLVDKICSFKNDAMEMFINFPPAEIDKDVKCFLYAEPKIVEQKIECRIPGCQATYSNCGNRKLHERTKHPTISISCKSCGLYAENKITIDKHNVRCHGALEAESNERVFEDPVAQEEKEQTVDLEIEENVSVANDDAILEVTATIATNNQQDIDWDDWQPDFDSFEQSSLYEVGYLNQSSVENVSLINTAIREPLIAEADGNVREGNVAIPILHQQKQNVVKLTKQERIAIIVDGRDVREIVIDIPLQERLLIGRHRDIAKLLGFVNAVSVHQFKESDILAANGVIFGPIDKRHNITAAMENRSQRYPGKIAVKLTMPYSTIPAPVVVSSVLQPINMETVNVFPSTYIAEQSTPSSSMQSELIQQNRHSTKTLTATSVVRFYSVSADVTDAHLADFCSQCGPVNHVERVMSKEKKQTIFVELAVKRAVVEAFVKKWAKGCQINHTYCVIQMAMCNTIFGKTEKAKVDMVAYKASKKSVI